MSGEPARRGSQGVLTVTGGRSSTARELTPGDRQRIMKRVGAAEAEFEALGSRVWSMHGGYLNSGPVTVHYEDPHGAGVPPAVLDALSGYPTGSVEFRRVTGPTTHGAVAGAVYGWGGSAPDAPGRSGTAPA